VFLQCFALYSNLGTLEIDVSSLLIKALTVTEQFHVIADITEILVE
jgi:hypothetical protein